MMNFVKILGVSALCVLLNGCGFVSKFKEPASETALINATDSPLLTEPETELATTPPPIETIPQMELETEAETAPLSSREIYRGMLSNLLANGEIAGRTVDLKEDTSQKQFAIMDIDGDSKEELILRIESDSSKTLQMVLDVDENGNLFKELDVFSNVVTYYQNGNLTAELPNQHGFSETFIPYTLYQYDSDSDGYSQIVTIHAMEKAFLSGTELEDIYPEDADTSQSGSVYYVGSDNPLDVTEYEEWCQSWQNQSSALEIPFQEITEEYIKNIQ